MINTVLTRGRRRDANRGEAAKGVLHGVKRPDLRGGPEVARKLGSKLAQRGEIAYWTPDRNPIEGTRADQRGGPREPMRLRSAKLLDTTYRFLCECRICDRSPNGLRLALARNIGLPPRLSVHIDETGEVRGAKVIWRRGPIVGIRLQEAAPPGAVRASDRYALRERYYAIPD